MVTYHFVVTFHSYEPSVPLYTGFRGLFWISILDQTTLNSFKGSVTVCGSLTILCSLLVTDSLYLYVYSLYAFQTYLMLGTPSEQKQRASGPEEDVKVSSFAPNGYLKFLSSSTVTLISTFWAWFLGSVL